MSNKRTEIWKELGKRKKILGQGKMSFTHTLIKILVIKLPFQFIRTPENTETIQNISFRGT